MSRAFVAAKKGLMQACAVHQTLLFALNNALCATEPHQAPAAWFHPGTGYNPPDPSL